MRLRRSTPVPQTFWDHLAELRTRIIVCACAIGVGAGGGVFLYDWLLTEIFLPPYCRVLEAQNIDRECGLVITQPLDGFKTRIRMSLYVGFVLSMPVLLWNLWRFITPALDQREKRFAIPFVVSGVTLFCLGAVVAYLTFEKALDFLISFGGDSVDPLFSPGSYLGLITYMMIAFGIGFEFPIVLIFLQLAGVVTPQQLSRSRRIVIVGIVVVAAIITPSGDPVSLAALSVPMYVFYELAVLIGRYVHRSSKAGLKLS